MQGSELPIGLFNDLSKIRLYVRPSEGGKIGTHLGRGRGLGTFLHRTTKLAAWGLIRVGVLKFAKK